MKKKQKLNTKKKSPILDEIEQRRVLIILVIVILLFLVVFVKLYQVTIIDHKKYSDDLEELSYDTVEGESTPRGRIYDRNYNIIVDNIAVKTIYYKKNKKISTAKEVELAYTVSKHLKLDFNKLTDRNKREFYIVIHPKKANKKITEKEWAKYEQRKLDATDIKELKIERVTEKELNSMSEDDNKAAYLYYLMNKGYAYDEKTIRTDDVTDEEYAYISENNEELVGFNTRLDWERIYPYGDTFKTMLGKVSTSSQGIPAELKDEYLKKGYSLNDRVGLSYIEKQYEDYLKGEKALYEVINSNELKLVKDGKRGNDIVLSIDIKLQQEIERIISEEVLNTKNEPNTMYYDHSAVIIQEPNTGEILAMASKQVKDGQIIDNTTSVLISPVTPGSVVKGASSLVGYNEGVIRIGETMVDECVKIKGTNEKCSSQTLGRINDITALSKSSNVFQFKTAIRVSGYEYSRGMGLPLVQSAFDKYRKMYHSFGLGVKTQIDLPVESLGYGATKDTRAGNLLDFVIGQYETYTPIQLSQYITTIANGGSRLQPHLLKEVHEATEDDSLGKIAHTVEKKVLNTVETKPEYMARIKEGFYAVMNAPGGYGRGYMEYSYSPAGKTGTSQSFIDTDNNGVIDTETITSNFVGYAPSDNPRMSITVVSPNSSMPNTNTDYASLVTMRITKRVANAYFNLNP
ncbi:MAG: penicillin-binding protein 2 [Bacilli bacterium]|nr:penicillin-binding protein 2 [Bacilli bacterium]